MQYEFTSASHPLMYALLGVLFFVQLRVRQYAGVCSRLCSCLDRQPCPSAT